MYICTYIDKRKDKRVDKAYVTSGDDLYSMLEVFTVLGVYNTHVRFAYWRFADGTQWRG